MKLLVLAIVVVVVSAAGFIYQPSGVGFNLNIPQGFPDPEIPADNLLSKERVELGKRLFFDPILSRDSSVSCATCHQPEKAFTDGLPLSKGIRDQIGIRNAPTLTNIVYHDKGLLLDAGVPTLEMQVLVPVQEHSEFDFDLKLIAERMKRIPKYVKLSRKAYDREPDPFVITRAIAAFERTLISGNSRYDQFKYQGKQKALTASEKKGLQLFSEKLHCTQCHSGFNFTDLSLQNNGLYVEPYPLDSGRMRQTKKEEDRDLFKTPTLRNIALTAPYMHDGSLASLEEVINHYSSGGQIHSHKNAIIKPFRLSAEEKKDLVNFLKSLTDEKFVERFSQ
jgi:cytochrome c peroxidase